MPLLTRVIESPVEPTVRSVITSIEVAVDIPPAAVKIKVSALAPPVSVSAPVPPVIVSVPEPPVIVSAPAPPTRPTPVVPPSPPLITSAPSPPDSASRPAPPVIVTALVAAPASIVLVPAPPVSVAAAANAPVVIVTAPPVPVAVTPAASNEVRVVAVRPVALKPASPEIVTDTALVAVIIEVNAVVAAVVSVSLVVMTMFSTFAIVLVVEPSVNPLVAAKTRLTVSAVPKSLNNEIVVFVLLSAVEVSVKPSAALEMAKVPTEAPFVVRLLTPSALAILIAAAPPVIADKLNVSSPETVAAKVELPVAVTA